MKDNLIRILTVVVGLFIFGFAISFFPDAGITGHVSVNVNSQTLDLSIKESQNYIISSASEDPIFITFIRLSGEVIGDGRAEILLDNGQGQKLVIFKNTVKKIKPNSITGMAIGAEAEAKESITLNMIPGDKLPYIFPEPAEDENIVIGEFANECMETCFIEMELSKDTTYALEFRVSEGTEIKLSNLLYGIRNGE